MAFPLLIILVLGPAIFCAKVASDKARNPFFWAGIGLTLNWLGVVAVLYVDPLYAKLYDDDRSHEEIGRASCRERV